MKNAILEALKGYQASAMVIVTEASDNNLKISTCGGKIFIEIDGTKNVAEILEACGIDVEAVVDYVISELE